MRIIKFRAWDKKQKKMMWGGQVHFSLPLSLDVFEFHKTTIHETPFHYHELMQFTGLLDKNGKEVYEGDIIDDGWSGYKGVVEWDDKAGEWIPIGSAGSTGGRYAGGKIIGNIYENPELLK